MATADAAHTEKVTAVADAINMKTAVVILNWNTEDFLRKFLPGLLLSCQKVEANCKQKNADLWIHKVSVYKTVNLLDQFD